MKLITKENGYNIYELSENECKKSGRAYPTFAAHLGESNFSQWEEGTVEEVLEWCKEQ